MIFNLLGALVSGASAGGSGGTAVTSSISYPRALGGDVSADQSYIVGENGREILNKTSGRVISNAQMEKMLGGPSHVYQISIDARGRIQFSLSSGPTAP